MARRAAGGVAAQSSASRANVNPPPSTLAAKIVDSRSNLKSRQQPEGKELFSKLLQDYLADPSIEEAHVETSAKLVTVVAEAGLDAAARLDPFSQNQHLEHARDSIAVIKLTVQRVPSVLFYTETSDSSVANLPVFLVLFSKVISLFGNPGLEPIRSDAVGLLNTCLTVAARSGKSWPSFPNVLEAVTVTVEDILLKLESRDKPGAKLSHGISIQVPSHRAIALLQPNYQDAIVYPHGTQANVDSVAYAALATLGLLQSIHGTLLAKHESLTSSKTDSLFLWDLYHRLSSAIMPYIHLGRGAIHLIKVLSGLCQTVEQVALSQKAAYRCSHNAVPASQLLKPLLDPIFLLKNTELQLAIARCFLEITIAIRHCPKCLRLGEELLQSSLITLIQDHESFEKLHLELQAAASSTCTALNLDGHQAANSVQRDLRLPTSDVGSEAIQSDERPSKRRRKDAVLSGLPGSPSYKTSIQINLPMLIAENGSSDAEFDRAVIDWFRALSPVDQGSAVTTLAELPCRSEQSRVSPQSSESESLRTSCCQVLTHERIWCSSADGKKSVKVLIALIGWTGLQRLKKCRTIIMLAISRFVQHSSDNNLLDISQSPLGQWCLKSLHSSSRELRIAAGRSMTAFLDPQIPTATRKSNHVYCLNVLRALTDRNVSNTQETLTMAWAQVARVCGEEELNTALLELVDNLGSPASLICAVAHDELERVAEFRGVTLDELFRPFWRTMAVAIVKDLQSRPQKLQHLCELLGVSSVGRFLLQTQAETIPYLVLTKNRDVLERIASVRNIAVKDLCLQPPKHLGLILATLLLQNYPDPEASVMQVLCDVAPEFTKTDLPALVRLEPITTACEMFKVAGDAHYTKKPALHQAIKSFAALAERRPGNTRAPAKSTKTLAQFLENHVLGILTRFSDVVDAPKDAYSLVEKRRCIRAISEMVQMATPHFNFSIAIPQIKACLQSAINEPELCDDSFTAWASFVSSLEEDDVEDLIEHTFAVIVRTWTHFASDTQESARALVAHLIKRYKAIVRERIVFLPSLVSIPQLSTYEAEIMKFKTAEPFSKQLEAFSERCADENYLIAEQALTELVTFLEDNQKLLQDSAMTAQPDPVIQALVSSLMDTATRFSADRPLIKTLTGQCLGIVGCIDLNKFDTNTQQEEIIVLSNFDRVAETVDFIAFLLQHVLVKAFHSAANGRLQNYLAWAMQELLKHCNFKAALQRSNTSQSQPQLERWLSMPESVRTTLMPYFHTKYLINKPAELVPTAQFPMFRSSSNHTEWLQEVVYSLLQRGHGENAKIFFPVLSRIIRGHDLSIPSFLMPYVITNVILAGASDEKAGIQKEMLAVLELDINNVSEVEADNVKRCSENVFQVLDYLSRWLQRKRKYVNDMRTASTRGTANSVDFDELKEVGQISSVEHVLAAIPPAIIARRAMDCNGFSRALFHWEKYMREQLDTGRIQEQSAEHDAILYQLQDIYSQIEEPDGIEGISAQLHLLDERTQVLEHRIHGRWAAAQSWYELELCKEPKDEAAQLSLLSCLMASGQANPLLKFVENRRLSDEYLTPQAISYAAQASWSTVQFDKLQDLLSDTPERTQKDFDVGVGNALLALRDNKASELNMIIPGLREDVVKGLSSASSASLKTTVPQLLRLHALYEIEKLSAPVDLQIEGRETLLDMLDSRLQLLGAVTANKQYLLGIRRAVMSLPRFEFTQREQASLWLTSARIARKADLNNVAFDYINQASRLDTNAALVEQSRLLWKDGSHKKAIQTLQGAISADAFHAYNTTMSNAGLSMVAEDQQHRSHNALLAKAQLLLARWTDQAGQMGSSSLIELYQTAIKSNPYWEKGHYSLGHYYNKMLESEQALPPAKQGRPFLSGETAKLVIGNYIRSIGFGAKYHYQTIPKILTLWLDLGQEVWNDANPGSSTHGRDVTDFRIKHLELMHQQIRKYVDRLSPYIFYTAFPQIISRIGHPNKDVWDLLEHIILRIAHHHPQQALWSLLATAKSTSKEKAYRGAHILSRLKQEPSRRDKGATPVSVLRSLISQGQKLTESLLVACEVAVDSRIQRVSLFKDLQFNHKLAPCGLVVPIEKTMTAILPTGQGTPVMRAHKAFPYGYVQIEAFQDEVLVLSSLQRPRKLTIRGSDGQLYGLLCKPKDDLRKDQRLMEFNTMIKRSLKRDVEASKRQLYIKTYGVVPLNEECGTIEWVDGLRPMRDIIISSYKSKGVRIDYAEIRNLLNEACSNLPETLHIFHEKVIPHFKPVLYEWFIDMFPEPEIWYAARLRYARSCAVMSVVGHILGLGDRHGENVLLESGSGGVFHVDFNCLFDKGLTFEKPEKVPFRLTHNMEHAFGACGVEGPFRKSAEMTLKVLRQHQDTLMTIMETFLYDPTADFLGSHRKKKSVSGVPETPQEVLESVRGKLRGLMWGDKVPLSVEGYVDALITQARDPQNLAEMYIGWCAFF